MIVFLSTHRTVSGGIGKIDVIIDRSIAEFLLHVGYRMHLSIYHPIFLAELLLYNFLFLPQLTLKVHQRLHDFRQLLFTSKLLTFFFEIRKQHEVLQVSLPVVVDIVAARFGVAAHSAIVVEAVWRFEFWIFQTRLCRHRCCRRLIEADHVVLCRRRLSLGLLLLFSKREWWWNKLTYNYNETKSLFVHEIKSRRCLVLLSICLNSVVSAFRSCQWHWRTHRRVEWVVDENCHKKLYLQLFK